MNPGAYPLDPTTPVGLVYGLSCVCHPDKGVMYVGMTRRVLKSRLRDHFSDARLGKSKLPVHNWIRKHGIENIRGVVLEVPSSGTLEQCEKAWINKMSTFIRKDKLNLTVGGDNIEFTDEIRAKQSASAKRRWENESPDAKERRIAVLREQALLSKTRDLTLRKPPTYTETSHRNKSRGENHYKSKITEPEAMTLYHLFKVDGLRVSEIAARSGRTPGLVWSLCKKKSWLELTDRLDLEWGATE